jgi:putative membrane protein
MKKLSYLAGLIGLAVTIVLVVQQGWHAIYSAIEHAGWGLLWLLPFHVLPLLLDAVGWRLLLIPRDPRGQARMPILLWIASIRESCDRLLPLANIGGAIIGIRMVKWRGISGVAATASVIIEVLLNVINQYLFIALGLLLLFDVTSGKHGLDTILIGLIASLPLPFVLIVMLRHGKVFSRLESLAEKLLGGESRLAALIEGERLDLEVRELFDRHWRVIAACAWQLAGLVVGSFESWFALRLLGYPVSIGDAIAIEAASQALRQLIFMVPAGLGVQEGGLLLFGSLIGLPPDAAIALSLVKRMREVAIGVPALISWQWAETRRLHAQWNTA